MTIPGDNRPPLNTIAFSNANNRGLAHPTLFGNVTGFPHVNPPSVLMIVTYGD